MAARGAGGVLAILTLAACTSSTTTKATEEPAPAPTPSVTPSVTPTRTAAPCTVTFCDDFERATIGDAWGSLDSSNETSIGDRAYTGEHSARFLVQDHGGSESWWSRSFAAATSVDLSFAFYAAASVGGPLDHANVVDIRFLLPPASGASTSESVEVAVMQYSGAIGLATDIDQTHQFAVPPDRLQPITQDWHIIHVTVDAVQKTAVLAVDGNAGPAYPFETSFADVPLGESPSVIFIGPGFSTGRVAFENDYDDLRLDVK